MLAILRSSAPAQSNFVTVTLKKQPNYPFYEAPAAVQLWATAVTDASNSVTKVSFLSGTNLVDPTVLTALYLNNLPAGYYTWQAIAQSSSGLLATSAVASITVTSNLLQNGGFEKGSFTNWVLVGTPNTANGWYNAVVYIGWGYPQGVVHSGNQGAALADIQLASLSQTIVTTPGQYYLLSLWLNNRISGTNQYFYVRWNTNSATTSPPLVSIVNPPAFSWTKLQFIVMASGTNSTLEIQAENDPNYFSLDDVYVTPIPRPSLQIDTTLTNGVELSWDTAPGVAYQIQCKTNLSQANWEDLISSAIATGYSSSVVDTNSSAAQQKFYRLVLP